jgi:hypothetical protein
MEQSAIAGFERIAQMLLEMKRLMEALETENRELRRQLDALQSGIDIKVVINGNTFQLANGQKVNQAVPQASRPETPAAPHTQQNENAPSPAKRENRSPRSPLADSFVL